MTKAKAISNEIAQNNDTKKVIFYILMTSSALLFIVYIYIIGTITFNIVARKSLENTVANLTEKVNNLEISYLNEINKTDKTYALSNGFVEVSNNIFATRDINHVAIR
jgi:hypothetical protein